MQTFLFSVLLLCMTAISSYAQHQADNWYFGKNAGITFKNGIATSIRGGQINTVEGCATQSDKFSGALLFYTDGVSVWNNNHQVMKNGTGLKGGTSSTQSALIVPNPANNLQYYIFTAPDLTPGDGNTSLYYSLVSLENPGGEVISKNNFLIYGVTEKLTGTIDLTGDGYWVLAHDVLENTFYAYHITIDGVDPNPITSVYSGSFASNASGYARISPNTKKVVLVSRYDGGSANRAVLSLFDFDNGSGKVSKPMVLETGKVLYYGAAFSPDNTKLYAMQSINSNDTLFQYDISSDNSADIRNSRVALSHENKGGAITLAPDGKIYGANIYTDSLSVINNPNAKAPNCDFRYKAFHLTDSCLYGLPNIMDYYLDIQTQESCFGGSVTIGPDSIPGYTYSWIPTIGLNSVNVSRVVASLTQSMEYRLKIVSDKGIITYKTYSVIVDTVFAIISGKKVICKGETTELLASGGRNYLWSPSVGLNNPTIANPIASPDTTTRYKVIVSSANCIDSAYITIKVNPVPKANAGADQVICKDERPFIGDEPQTGYTYSWSPAAGLDNPTSSKPLAIPSKTTTYILTVRNQSGCYDYDTVKVTVGKLQAVVSADTTICEGSSVQLSASGGSNYRWSPSEGLDNPTIANPTASPNRTIQYAVVISSGDCADSTLVTVSVNPKPIADAGEDKVLCVGEQVAIGSAPIAGNTYSWSPIVGLSNPNVSQPIATPASTTTYTLRTALKGCEKFDSVKVTVKQPNEYIFTLNPSSITVLPDKHFQTALSIPSGVQLWNLWVNYDSRIVKFDTILQIPAGINCTATEQNGRLILSGSGENGVIILKFKAFLPYNTDTTFLITLIEDSTKRQPCETNTTRGNTLELGSFCGRNIRVVTNSGKNYFLTTKENGVNFGVGLTGNVRIELYDNIGSLKEVLVSGNLEAGEYGLDFDIPTGVYFCRMSAGMFERVGMVVIVR